MDMKIDFGAARIGAGAGRPDTDAGAPALAEPRGRVSELNDHVQLVRRELNFRVDETTGVTVLRVVDVATGALVRQLPSRNVLEMMDRVDRMQANSGLLLREQA
jgi:flagellar protein FlaG